MSHLTKISRFLCLVPCALYLFACTGKHQSNKNIFHYNEQTGIASLDPAFAKNQSIMWAVHQLYSTLVEIDKDLNIVPSIAKSWEISGDRRMYTFHLRNDVFFHDDVAFTFKKGRQLIAQDV